MFKMPYKKFKGQYRFDYVGSDKVTHIKIKSSFLTIFVNELLRKLNIVDLYLVKIKLEQLKPVVYKQEWKYFWFFEKWFKSFEDKIVRQNTIEKSTHDKIREMNRRAKEIRYLSRWA